MKKNCLIIAALAAVTLLSCAKQTEILCEETVGEGLVPIDFTTGVGSFGYDVVTRSGLETMKQNGFGLMGYNTGEERFDADNPAEPVFDNFRLTSADGVNWDYAGKTAYWNRSTTDKYTFLAYHPYSEAQSSEQLAVPAGPAINDCIDYMTATPVTNCTTRGNVKLAFRHIFPKLNTMIYLTDAYDGQEYTLTEVSFSGVRQYPSFSFAKNDFDRTSVESCTITSETGNIRDATLGTVEDMITVDPIFICPYDYSAVEDGVKVKFSFDYVFTDSEGTETVQQFTKELVLNNDFESNREYDLKVAFTPDEKGAVNVAVTVDDYSGHENMDMKVEHSPDYNLSKYGTANCYIVTGAGRYHFDATCKGNDFMAELAEVAEAEVLWESYGTDEEIEPGDLVSDLRVDCGTIYFKASDRKGNALIAAKDSEGNILWSWHIWLTDKPADQVYKNNAGISMDRNLGATSARNSDGIRAHGLLYQWGRKDPFLNSSSINGNDKAANTGTWPEDYTGKIEVQWLDANPMTFAYPGADYSWLSASHSDRWALVGGGKTFYDPCPPGYRVPVATGQNNFYKIASGDFTGTKPAFSLGMNLGANSSKISFTSDSVCWYPATSCMESTGGSALSSVKTGHYWMSGIADRNSSYALTLANDSRVYVSYYASSNAYSVRCVKE